ncbi:hypothetical protein [Undibacterium sp.]|uniref:hypothetical protein n=1 Tax=Undibacterium sp. TaxID=1914977 RepID=UPI002BF4AA5D|nr:hypothetical protein [Undibacterium sp.]HTD02231.1 hypothetical protein [Undibacterium sp.]
MSTGLSASRFSKYLPLALCFTFAASSTTAADRPQVNWQEGAKLGTIEYIYDAETPEKDLPDCLATLPKKELSSRHFVKVWYRHVRLMRHEVAELPDDLLHAKVDDHVEIWPADCSRGKLSRISKVFSPAP